ncbi:MAG: ribonuclease toxin HepT-like protein [Candidatus Anammoxibacter sp.]
MKKKIGKEVGILAESIWQEREILENTFQKIKGISEAVILVQNKDEFKAFLGYEITGYYTLCENIFIQIIRFFENDLNTEQWHKNLLKRASLKFSDFRPAVISPLTLELLDELRTFRHRFNHYFRTEINPKRIWQIKEIVLELHPVLEKDLRQFLRFLDSLKKKEKEGDK